MKKNLQVLLALAMVCVFALTGCSGNSSTTEEVADSTTEEPAEEVEEGESATETWKIVFSITDSGSAAAAYWSNLHVELGPDYNMEITVLDPQGDASTQSQQIMDAIALDIYDALIVYPNDPEGIIPALKAAKEAGMVVEIFGSDIAEENAEYRDFMVACDDYVSGQVAAQALMEQFPDGANIVEVGLQSGLDAQVKRHNGFVDELAESNINILATQNVSSISSNEAMNVMQDLLVKYGDEIDAVYCHWDDGLNGCILAEENAGLDPTALFQVGIDGNQTGFTNVEAGKQSLSIMQNFDNMTVASLELMNQILSGEEIESVNMLDWDLITADTIGNYEFPAW